MTFRPCAQKKFIHSLYATFHLFISVYMIKVSGSAILVYKLDELRSREVV